MLYGIEIYRIRNGIKTLLCRYDDHVWAIRFAQKAAYRLPHLITHIILKSSFVQWV